MANPSRSSLLRIYWVKELKCLLRDRNILIYGLLLPLFLYPTLLFGITEIRSLTSGMREGMKTVIAIDRLPGLESYLQTLEPPAQTLPLMTSAGDTLAAGTADLVIVAAQASGRILVSYDSNSGRSRLALERFQPEIERWRRNTEQKLLGKGPHAASSESIASLRVRARTEDLSAQTSSTRGLLATLLPLILIVMCTFGATWPALELTAGERERCSSETTFLLPLSRQEIALAKSLAVASSAFVTLLAHLFAMLIAAGPLLAELRGGSFALPSLAWQTLPLILCYGALLSMVFGNVFLLAGSYAKSFREAQAYVTPLQLVLMLPAMLTLLPGAQLNSTTAWIPVYNAGLAFRAALLGEADLRATFISLLSLGTCALLCFRATVHRLSDTSFALGFADHDRIQGQDRRHGRTS